MHWHDLLLVGLSFFSELIGTLSGFGSSTFFVPAAVLIEKFQLVLVLSAILHCFGNVTKVILFRKNFEWRQFFILALPSVILSVVGALLSDKFPTDILKKSLGVVLVLVSLLFLMGRLKNRKVPPIVAYLLTAFSGLSTGLVGTGGALRGIALTSLKLAPGPFVALSAAIDFGGDFLRTIVYLQNGYMDWSQWFYIPLFGLMAYLGTKLGKRILLRMRQEQFEKTVAVFVLLAGLMLFY